MYKKLFKNFIAKNYYLFFLIFFSLSFSLFWYIFSDSLWNNFLQNIEQDSRVNLGWDFTIDIWNKPESYFNDFFEVFPYKDQVEIAKSFSLRSSVNIDKIIPTNIIFTTTNYPFYSDFNKTIINTGSELSVSNDFFTTKLKDENTEIEILWNKYKVWSIFEENPKTINSFFGDENIFFPIEKLDEMVVNDTNSLIEKTYYLKLKDNSYFSKIKYYLENTQSLKWNRIRDAKDWWDRFSEIILNLKSYINYVVLFSLFLTVVIIFISVSSYFIKERREISILRVLWLRNKNLILFNWILFFSVFIFSYITAVVLSYIWFYFLSDIEYTKGFSISPDSLFSGFILWIIVIIWSFIIPLLRFINSEINSWFSVNFYSKISKREYTLLFIFTLILVFIIWLTLWYDYYNSIIISISLLSLLLILFLVFKSILLFLYKRIEKCKNINFMCYDSVRSTVKPWNLSFLVNTSFLIIFSICLFITVLFGHFYDRLKINLETDHNFFVINITEETYKNLEPKYQKESYSTLKWRIIAINGINLEKHFWRKPSGQFTREFSITDNVLSDLDIVSWKEVSKWWVTVDYDFSKELWIKVWDLITFQIYWIEKVLKVQGIRESIDYSINPFFYFQVDKEEFSKFPKIYFLSSYIESKEKENFKEYIYDLSSWASSFIDVENILQELKQISQKVFLVIIIMFFYLMIFCILSVWVVSLFFRDFQEKKSHLYRLIWATKKQNRNRIFLEYSYLATVSLFISFIIISAFLYYFFYNNNFLSFDFHLYLIWIWVTLWIYGILLWLVWGSLWRSE